MMQRSIHYYTHTLSDCINLGILDNDDIFLGRAKLKLNVALRANREIKLLLGTSNYV